MVTFLLLPFEKPAKQITLALATALFFLLACLYFILQGYRTRLLIYPL